MRSANLFFFTQPQETFQDWLQGHQNEGFEEKVEPFFAEFQQIPINYGTITDTAYQDSLYWKEQHLYGSSRLGIAKPELEVTNYKNSNFSLLTSNFKNYELTNHLGNILATIKDEKQQIDQNADGIVDYYEPIVITANDYYPFGMVMPNRSFSLGGNNYRFGFNGKENDNEVDGQQDYGLRIYDNRIGRFKSVDPWTDKFPWYTPYQFAGNSPIRNTDLDGGEPKDYMETWKATSGSDKSGHEILSFYDNETKMNYTVKKVMNDNSNGWNYYWSAKMSSDGNSAIANSSHPINESGNNASNTCWAPFTPNSSVKANQKMMYEFADNFPKFLAGTAATIVTAGLGGFALSTNVAGSAISGTLDATFQTIYNGGKPKDINYVSVGASMLFKNPFTSSYIGSQFEYSTENKGLTKKSFSEVAFETGTGGFGGKVGGNFSALTSDGFSVGMKQAIKDAALEGTTQGAIGGGLNLSKEIIKDAYENDKNSFGR